MDFNSCSRSEGFWILTFKKIKRILILAAFSLVSFNGYSQVAINTTGNPPDPDAMLDVSSSNKGLLIPRISLANRPSALKTGMLLYQIDNISGFYFANGTDWVRLGDEAQDYWLPAVGSDIRFPNKIALGTYTDAMGHGLNVANYATAKGAVRGTIESGGAVYAEGMLGVLDPSSLGISFPVTNIGVMGIKPNTGSNGAAIFGWNYQNQANGNFAGLFIGNGTGSFDNYAIYSKASGGSNNYAGFYRGRVKIEGNTVDDSAPDYLSTLLEAQVMHNQANDTRAVHAVSKPQPGWGIGI